MKIVGIEHMLDGVIIIDNIKSEVEGLIELLRGYDISVDAPDYTDNYDQMPVYTRNRQLVFMDLMLDEDLGHLATNISRIIRLLNHIVGDNFGPYGLVLWTKHLDKMTQVLERLDVAARLYGKEAHGTKAEDDEIVIDISLSNPPVFVIGIDKMQFNSSGTWDFSKLIPILNQEIQGNNASYFFLRWLSVTRQASKDTISSIYGLTRSYENKEAEISYLLYKLALNQTGISHYYPGLTSDAYKAFSDVMHPKINVLVGHDMLPNLQDVKQAYSQDDQLPILSRLNSILFIDNIGIDQNEIMPGNVYEVKDVNSPVVVKQEERVELKKIKSPNSKELIKYKDYECVPIAMELTPPCDFSHKKVLSRVIGGYIIDISANAASSKKLDLGGKGYLMPPIMIPGDNNPKYIIFDFRHLYSPKDEQLKDPSQYKVLFRANHSLFSDVLQKFSSHAARLGLNGLEPW